LGTCLRREAASRLLEDGIPLHHVSLLLGHTSVTQTATYLSVTESQLEASLAAVIKFRNQRAGQARTRSPVRPPVRGLAFLP
jgi:integrase